MSSVEFNTNRNINTDNKHKQEVIAEHPFELRHEVKNLNQRLEGIIQAMESAEFKDILENYTSPKKRIIANLTAGIARGLGMSIGTVLVLAILGWVLSLIVDMNLPVIGQYIAELQGYIDASK
ncbi:MULTISPECIES: DUF5665 domain-containing protein [unclassified Paenibacillus]|uniref:DUF5665 domain-containing protein n=1 Tax=Paenibacillus provencensis TaxID=441151 RepID=A0ABW3PYE2_9BACL|nr:MULTISPECIES: DUF5665 domain-containing protein [unclassified Paenibacillus]MCM3130395.1 DUF5665 domain-containing protein [Paenibacillus sp. MER 78]SFS93417.1 hypothetical protein SAMN04488601_10825 [Paenibacillus sp. 453mf]